MNIVSIQDKVKMIRMRRYASHADAGKILGVASTSYTRRENGKIGFSPEEVFSLCDAWDFNRHFVVGDFPLDSADRSVHGNDLDAVMKYLERVPPAKLKDVAEYLERLVTADQPSAQG